MSVTQYSVGWYYMLQSPQWQTQRDETRAILCGHGMFAFFRLQYTPTPDHTLSTIMIFFLELERNLRSVCPNGMRFALDFCETSHRTRERERDTGYSHRLKEQERDMGYSNFTIFMKWASEMD